MDKQKMKDAMMEVEDLIEEIEGVIDGENIGVIIPSLLFWLSQMHNEEIMSLDAYIEETGKTIRSMVNRRNEMKGEMQWLQ